MRVLRLQIVVEPLNKPSRKKKLFRNGDVSNVGNHWREQGRCNGKYNKKDGRVQKTKETAARFTVANTQHDIQN